MSDYGFFSKLFHKLALDNESLCEAFFDIESKMYTEKSSDSSDAHHIFVAGLARAGTTILMRCFHTSQEFGSLTYRDMPMVLSPNLWSKLSGLSVKYKPATERAHGDGLCVDFDSPEALEEVYWRVFHSELYLKDSHLVAMKNLSSDDLSRYCRYIDLILLKYGKNRYLSKNNNNILRIPLITEMFPNATVLIPYRQPAQQAYSLLTQHRSFIQKYKVDKFTSQYMGWLGHHEFGMDHRKFVFDNADDYRFLDENSINYWIEQWITVYSYLLRVVERSNGRVMLVGYEQLCNSDRLRDALISTVDCHDLLFESLRLAPLKSSKEFNPDLMAEAEETYSQLESKSREQFGIRE